MPVAAYVGLPRHGKSYGVVENVILPALAQHRCVVTNIPLEMDLLREKYPGCDIRVLDVAALLKAPASIGTVAPAGCVLVIDEVWRLWPAGQSVKDVPEAFKSILAEHGHRVDALNNSMQVVLVTQDLGQIGKFARDLVEETYRVSKMLSLGSATRYRVDIYRGPVTGQNPPARQLVNTKYGRYKPEVYRFYKSHTMSEAASSGANEAKIDQRGSVWKSWVWWALAPVMLAGFVWGIYAVTRVFKAPAPEALRAVKGESASARPGGKSDTTAGRPVPAVRQWYIVAELQGGGFSDVWLSDGEGYVRLDSGRWCDRDVGGFLVCTWEGRRISGQVHRLPPRVPVSPQPSALDAVMGVSPQG